MMKNSPFFGEINVTRAIKIVISLLRPEIAPVGLVITHSPTRREAGTTSRTPRTRLLLEFCMDG